MKHEKSYGVIVAHVTALERTKYLLIKTRGTNDWSFPKGHAGKNESPIEAALRELREETGVSQVKLIPDVSFSEIYEYEINGTQNQKRATFFVGVTPYKDVTIQPDEVEDYTWSDYDDSLQTLTFKSQRKMLSEVTKLLETNSREYASF